MSLIEKLSNVPKDNAGEALALEYQAAVKRPAEVVYDCRQPDPEKMPPGDLMSVPLLHETSLAKTKGVEDAFVIANVLSPQECQELIQMAETEGLVPPQKEAGTLRTAKRTDKYQSEELSQKISSRVEMQMKRQFDGASAAEVDENNNVGKFHGIHPNWRILKYEEGDAFPAHQDQMDSMQLLNKTTGTKDLVVSTHTLLINLSSNLGEGGATRFYPRAKLASKASGQYDHAVDVWLPQGWALAFPQLGMVHAGQPVTSVTPKYVAQAGVLRRLPPGKLIQPSIFRLGPGLKA